MSGVPSQNSVFYVLGSIDSRVSLSVFYVLLIAERNTGQRRRDSVMNTVQNNEEDTADAGAVDVADSWAAPSALDDARDNVDSSVSPCAVDDTRTAPSPQRSVVLFVLCPIDNRVAFCSMSC